MNSSNENKVLNIDLTKDWEQFIINGKVDSDLVRHEILESWQRCFKAKVDPYDGTSHLILKQQEIDSLRDEHAELIEIAWHFMIKLYEFVAGSGFIVLLSDERGFIMNSIGDDDILNDASKVKLMIGTGWMEEEVGTNGIGTALKLKQPIQISGQEHYCKKLHCWTCSASPIFDYDGRIVGALQMSGPSDAVHLHTLGMVVAAVEAIRDQLRVRKKNQKLTVLNSSLQNIFQTMSDGAVIINRAGIITQVNPVAEQTLGFDLKGRSMDYLFGKAKKTCDVLEKGKPYTDVEFRTDNGTANFHCLVTGKPIKDDNGEVTGAVIFFNPINKVKKLINRFSGAQATFRFDDIIGNSKNLRAAIELAKQAASNNSNILIAGESGTGKELFAQAIHNYSERRRGPFVALNCGAIPRELVASELFGYSEGAFTGASRGGRPGKFELATGGTLFLDEIGDMPLEQQVALLRVLQERKVTRLGGDQVIPVDVRVICATNKNLKNEVKKGNFREDLYYRLNVIFIEIPPLRERDEDISLLFEHILAKTTKKMNTRIDYVQPAVLKCLQNYSWPGNVRELENVVEKMISSSNGPSLYLEQIPADISGLSIDKEELPSALSNTMEIDRVNGKLTDLLTERNILIDLLAKHQGNISRVAKEMGFSRNTIYRKMQFYDISRKYNFNID